MILVIAFDLFDLEPKSSFATRPRHPASPSSGNEGHEGFAFLKPNLSGIALRNMM